jgi:heme A synthase
MTISERLLRLVLRATGIVCLVATFAVFMPTSWMAWCHERLGLGNFPDAPITGYLARSLSAFYAIYGGALVLVAVDLRRYAAVIAYLAWTGLVLAVVIGIIDAVIGLPAYWTVAESVSGILLSVVILVLQRNIRAADARRNSQEVKP